MTGDIAGLYGSSSGPNISLVKRFRLEWHQLDEGRICTGTDDANMRLILEPTKDEVIRFARHALEHKTKIFKDDYREFLELSIIYLGGETPAYNLKKAGSLHSVQWMVKVIYILKMWIFYNQLTFTTKDLKCIRDISSFAVKVHLKAEITSQLLADAPQSDLKPLQSLKNYYDLRIRKGVTAKLESHLWYLSEEMVALSLFDRNVPSDEKRDCNDNGTQRRRGIPKKCVCFFL